MEYPEPTTVMEAFVLTTLVDHERRLGLSEGQFSKLVALMATSILLSVGTAAGIVVMILKG